MPRTGENIYRRQDGRWEGRYAVPSLPGEKTKYKSVYGKTYTMVRQKLHEAEQNKDIPCADTQSTSISELAGYWMQSIRMKVKESTYSRYCHMLQSHILPDLGDIAANELSAEIVEKYLNTLLTQGRLDRNGGLSCKTVKDLLGLLKELMQFAQKNNIVSDCLIDDITLKQEKKEKEILNESDRIRLVSCMTKVSEPIKTGIILCLYTGLRIGELCALRWKEIDLSNKVLYVKYTMLRIQDYSENRKTKTKLIRTSPKSKSSVRFIPLPNFLAELLKSLQSTPEAYFLSGDEDRLIEPRYLQLQFKKYLKECEIRNVSFHCLRHTFSTICLRSGMDSKTLSELLGHSSVNITLNNYVHSSLDYKRESMNNLVLFR
jgi:integrase